MARTLSFIFIPVSGLYAANDEEVLDSWTGIVKKMEVHLNNAYDLYTQGKFKEAYDEVNVAYFRFYESKGMEKITMGYLSGARKTTVENAFYEYRRNVYSDKDNEMVKAHKDKLIAMLYHDAAELDGTLDESGSETAMQDAVAKQSVEQLDMSGTVPLKPLRAEDLDWATEYERASLAETMRGIESGIGAVLRGAAENPFAVGADIQMYLVRQLNAYGHHQKALGHSLAGDPYLSSVPERLDALDPKGENPLVSEIRSLVSTTMSGKNIELFEKDGHSDLVRRYCAYLGIHMGDAMKVKDKAGDYFNDKTAIYAFFQEMSRKAKCTEELLEAMLGDRAGEKEEEGERSSDLSQLITERKSDLEDGMTVYKESLRKLHRTDGDAGEGADGKLSERERAEEKEEREEKKKEEKPKEEIKKIEDTEIKPEIKKEDPKIEESKGGGSYIFLGIIVLAVVGAGYYFKIYKKKQDDDTEDEEEYDELEDEYEREDDAENLEEKEQQTIDDMAIDSYDEEDEE